jgi:hypothetical protein
MTRELHEIVDESYKIFTLVLNKFEADKRFKNEGLPPAYVSIVSEMTQHILVNERIDESQDRRYGYRNPSQTQNTPSKIQDNDKMVTVRLTDGKDLRTQDVKDVLKNQYKFWWNTPQGSYDWNKKMHLSEWLGLATLEPFCNLTAKVVE